MKKKYWYVNTKNSGKIETVDEYDTLEHAEDWLRKFQEHSMFNKFWVSSKCTKEWKELFKR